MRGNYLETVLWKAAQGSNLCSFAIRGYLISEALLWNQIYCFALLYLHIQHGWFYEMIFGLQLSLGNSWPNFAKFEEHIIRHKLYHSRTKLKQNKIKTHYSVSSCILFPFSMHNFSASNSEWNKFWEDNKHYVSGTRSWVWAVAHRK